MLVQGVKQSGRKAYKSSLFSAEGKKERISTTAPIYTFMKCAATILTYNFVWQGNHRYLKHLYEKFLDLWLFSEVHGKQFRTVCGLTAAEY